MSVGFTNIYSLSDPVTNEVRYIGKTCQKLNRRLSAHTSLAPQRRTTYVARWVHSLAARPIIRLLFRVEGDGSRAEIETIARYRANGFRLVNLTDGGDGGLRGVTRSAETRARISAANKGKTNSPEARAKMSAALKGRKLSAETRAKIGIKSRGRAHTPESKAKIGAANKGRIVPLSARMAVAAANRLRVCSPETLAKLSVASANRTHSLETRAKIGAYAKNRERRMEGTWL